MNTLTDLMLPRPLPLGWIEGLLFAVFFLHLAFVLLLLGTAIMAFAQHVAVHAGASHDAEWTERLLKPFLPFEALAVVLGVGPLLLIQVGYTLNFFSAANILAPYWVLLVAFMIVAFLCFDVLEHRGRTRRWSNLILGAVGLTCLLAIPGVFVAVLVLAERPDAWIEAIRSHDRIFGRLGWLWLVRYAHVLGAAIVIAAIFQLLWSGRDHPERRRPLTRWLYGGIAFQIAIGVTLYVLVFARAEWVTHALVVAGVLAVLATAALAATTSAGAKHRPAALTASALAVLLAMLLARETLQQGTFAATAEAGRIAAAQRRRELAPHATEALAEYERASTQRYDDGDAIYERSCAFCHGARGDARGVEARRLRVAPEALRDVRTTRAELYRILTAGVPGSAMPAFAFYDRDKLDVLTGALDRRFEVLGPPRRVHGVQPGASAEATLIWAETCVECHGADGRPSAFGAAFRPAPPDLSAYSLVPAGAFAAITEGVPGTMMVSFAALPEDVRWGLAEVAISLRTP